MRCIKTGCDVYIEPYGEWAHGDAFQSEGGTLLIRVCAFDREQSYGAKRHFTIMNADLWFDRDKTSQGQNSTLVCEPGQYVHHGYEGVPEKEFAS